MIEKRGALEALERVLNRGGEPDEVLDEVVRVLHGLYQRVAIRIVHGSPSAMNQKLSASHVVSN